MVIKAYSDIMEIWSYQSIYDTEILMGFLSILLTLGVNLLRLRQNRRHFTDDIFKCIFLNKNAMISIKISLRFIARGSINNIPALVQIMAWRRPGDKPLSEPTMVTK